MEPPCFIMYDSSISSSGSFIVMGLYSLHAPPNENTEPPKVKSSLEITCFENLSLQSVFKNG